MNYNVLSIVELFLYKVENKKVKIINEICDILRMFFNKSIYGVRRTKSLREIRISYYEFFTRSFERCLIDV